MSPITPISGFACFAVRAATAGLAAAWVAYVVQVVFGLGLETFFSTWVYLAVMIGAAIVTAARAVLVAEDRLAWSLLAGGVAVWAGGDLLWAVHFNFAAHVPTPSVADLLYYLTYPLQIAGLALLMRRHLQAPGRAFWLDGLIVGLAAAAIVAAAVFDRIADTAAGGFAATATTLGYPVLDLATLCLATLAIGLTGWRPGRAWALFGGYLLTVAVADAAYGYAEAAGATTTGLIATLWPGAALMLAMSAWQDWSGRRAVNDGSGTIVMPALGAVAALGVLAFAALASSRLSPVSAGIATVALTAVIVRGAMTFRENHALLARTRNDAVTDALTGLENRRSLLADLDRVLAAKQPRLLVFCDLDGFKLYNDTFGHLAGDALLTRLAGRLAEATRDGKAYRLGGDEFCVLLGPATGAIEEIREALTESGEGFRISASAGVVALPDEAVTASRALQLADERMYADKTRRRPSANRHARDLLLQILVEREPALGDHTREVAGYAVAVARELGLENEECDELARAADLHDVGKIAIPDRVLYSDARLSETDWELLRAHPLVGERILASHPALVPVARIVRSMREHWGGGGYPDGLVGEAIPLGARIIAVCNAFDAMLAHRPDRPARAPADALAELRACAGTQFDPRVVDAFVRVVEANRAPAITRTSPAVLH